MEVKSKSKTKSVAVAIIGTDCSAGGLSRGKTRGKLWLSEPRPDEIDPEELNLIVKVYEGIGAIGPGRKAVRKLTPEEGCGSRVERVRLYALYVEDGEIRESGNMFSGLWAISSDSGFPYETPVPLHTRVEG